MLNHMTAHQANLVSKDIFNNHLKEQNYKGGQVQGESAMGVSWCKGKSESKAKTSSVVCEK